MSYLDIDNLYKDQTILLFKECYALEKIHGTSAHIKWHNRTLTFFAGGGSYESFVKLFDTEYLMKRFVEIFADTLVTCYVYGESYAGKMQGMSGTYGKEPKFICFDVNIDGKWLNVPKAEDFVRSLNLEYVHYVKCLADIKTLDEEVYAPSVQAKRNGIIDEDKKREGVVLRPLEEFIRNNGRRVISKHKHPDFRETKTLRKVSPEELQVLTDARAIAEEWVTEERLNHILTSGKVNADISKTGEVIKLMVTDIEREAADEVVLTSQAKKEISKATALLFKQRLNRV